MEKKKLYGNTLKEQYLASARDRRHSFLLADGAMRGVILNGTRMVNEMRSNHELGVLETWCWAGPIWGRPSWPPT